MSGKARFMAALKKLAPPLPPPAVEPPPAPNAPGCAFGAWTAQRIDDLEARLNWQRRALALLGLVVALKLLGLQIGLDELMQLAGLVK